MEINSGDFFADLMFPHCVMDYIHEQDRAIFEGRLIRAVYHFVMFDAKAEDDWSAPVVVTAGSRASSMRMPKISILKSNDQEPEIFATDIDIMTIYKDIFAGTVNGETLLNFVADEQYIGYGKFTVNSLKLDAFSDSSKRDSNDVKYLNGKRLIRHLLKTYVDSRVSK